MLRTIKLITLLVFVSALVFANDSQHLRPGNPAPNFSGQSLEGTQYDLDKLHGKIVVLTFWSTRCEICRAEIPNLNRVVDRYRGQDVVFLAVTMDSEAKVELFLRKNPFSFTIMPNSFGVMLKYADRDREGNINMGFPAHFVVDRDGRIAFRTEGWDKAPSIESSVARLLVN